jgi:hypothetical protein
VAKRGPADQLLTCDFCLEEFPAPAAKVTSPTKPTAPANREKELPSKIDEPSKSAENSPDPMGFDLSSGESDSDLGFADELPGTTPHTSSEHGGPSPDGDPSGLSDEQWLRVDEDLTTPEEDHPARKVVLTEDYEFSGPCPLCATRFVATDDQIGTTIRCPDCYTEFEIHEPLPNKRQPRRHGSGNWDDDDELRISEPDDLANIESPADDPLGSPIQSIRPMPNATSWPRDETGADGQAAVASAILQKAEADVEEQEAEETTLPPSPLMNGVLGCFVDPSLLMRWVLFAIGIQIELAAANATLSLSMSGKPTDQFLGMMVGVFSVLFGMGLMVSGSVSLLAITQDTASGRDQIENFPGANFMDWGFDAFYVLCAAFVCLLVGTLAGQIFLPFGVTIYVWGLLAAIGLSTGIVFPLYLLAVLETGSPINPMSKPLWRSLRLARGTWIRFAIMSLGLAIAGVLGCLLRYAESTLLSFLSAMIVSGVLILYFRLLGRLTWTCQEAVAEDESLREEAS